MLLSAVGTLAACVSILFLWARDRFTKCEDREKECSDKYEKILLHLAGVKD